MQSFQEIYLKVQTVGTCPCKKHYIINYEIFVHCTNDTHEPTCDRHKPGMKRFRWRWNDSRDVEPLAHLYTGICKPPFVSSLVLVYRATPAGSWMHLTCLLWTLQMCSILSLSSKGTPRASLPVVPMSICSSSSSIRVVVSSPRVLRRQWRVSSSLVRGLLMSL